MRVGIKIVLLGILCLFSSQLMAQNPNDAARYYDQQANQTGANFNTSGAFGLLPYDFASVVFNPAMSALYKHSTVDLGLSGVMNSSKAEYLSTSTSSTESEFSLNSFSGVFKFPTLQGSLALAVGYNKMADFTNHFTANGFNTQNSISDYYAQSSDANLRLIGYNGYATDSTGSDLQSMLRFGGFTGIDQFIQQKEAGQYGEFVLNASTEFQKGMFVGFTIGIPLATYSFERLYLEEDLANRYVAYPSNVESILATEQVNADGAGIYAKLGIVVKPSDNIQLGLSYQTPYSLELNETYSYSVYTVFDDGVAPSESYPYRLNGDFTYKIKIPSIIQFGMALDDVSGFDFGFTADYRNYSSLEFETASEFKLFEIKQNKAIQSRFRDVLNMSAGVGYKFGSVKYQIGAAYLPTYENVGGTDRLVYSTGIDAKISDQLNIFAGVRYQTGKQDRFLYSTTDYGSNPSLKTNGSWLTTQIGLKFKF